MIIHGVNCQAMNSLLRSTLIQTQSPMICINHPSAQRQKLQFLLRCNFLQLKCPEPSTAGRILIFAPYQGQGWMTFVHLLISHKERFLSSLRVRLGSICLAISYTMLISDQIVGQM